MHIEYIAFDLGNVLLKVDLTPFTDTVYDMFRWSPQKTMLFMDPVHHDLGITNLQKEFYREFKAEFTSEMYAKLFDSWTLCVTEVPEITELIEELGQEQYKIALLSNIGEEHALLIRSSFSRTFNKCIQHFSYEVGARKPTKLYFQSFLWSHPEFNNCIFVDDKPENIKTANSLGLDGRCFALDDYKDNKSATVALRKLLGK